MRILASLSTSQLAIFLRSLRLLGRGGLVGRRQGLAGRFGGSLSWIAARSLLKANLRTSATFCAVALSQARQVLLEGHVERPVQRVLDAPVAADGLGEPGGGETAGGNVVARVEPGAILQFGPRFDPDDGARVDEADFAGKAPVAVEPVDLAQHRDGAGFDAAVAFVVIDIDIDLAFAGGVEGGLDISLQGRLVAFDGEQIVSSGGADGLSDLGMALSRRRRLGSQRA